MDLEKIDAIVAEHVMGWHMACGNWIDQSGLSTGYGCDEGTKDFQPSTDIADAWKVAERLQGHHSATLKLETASGWVTAAFSWWAKEADYYVSGYSKSDTAPLAICLAALKAKNIEVQT